MGIYDQNFRVFVRPTWTASISLPRIFCLTSSTTKCNVRSKFSLLQGVLEASWAVTRRTQGLCYDDFKIL